MCIEPRDSFDKPLDESHRGLKAASLRLSLHGLPCVADELAVRPIDESFSEGLLEYPQYTRPAEFDGAGVPGMLVSGHHEQVRRWRLRESLRRTLERRPDLLAGRPLSKEEARLLAEDREGMRDESGDRSPDA